MTVFNLAEIRRVAGATQIELGRRLGRGQRQISRTEHQSDMLVNTLTFYGEALGVEAELVVRGARAPPSAIG